MPMPSPIIVMFLSINSKKYNGNFKKRRNHLYITKAGTIIKPHKE